MPKEYTPTTEDVREAYLLAAEHFHDCGRTFAEHREQFDRWLAAHDAEVRAPLEAEVERLRTMLADSAALNREALRDGDAERARAEAAEAKVRAGLALADDMERQPVSEIAPVSGMAIIIRAALADPTCEAIWLGPGVDSLQADPPERP